MSERKEEIFKENSTNKNPPCPNTPSSFNGELEGRKNLSNVSAKKPCQDKAVQQNKLYSAIGINQKLFKQKPLENKKASVPQPTKRDLLLLETLESYGVLSTKQIRELNEQGIKVINTHPNVKHRSETDQYEYDIIATNGKEIVVVEVKTTLKVQHIKYFLEDLKKFTVRLPDFKGKTVYGAVAYLRAEEEAARYAERQGLFVIKATGSSASIVNKKDFKPKAFA